MLICHSLCLGLVWFALFSGFTEDFSVDSFQHIPGSLWISMYKLEFNSIKQIVSSTHLNLFNFTKPQVYPPLTA